MIAAVAAAITDQELAGLGAILLFAGFLAALGRILSYEPPASQCDHDGTSVYVGHVLVDAIGPGNKWAEGQAPAYRCHGCLREWTGDPEPLPLRFPRPQVTR